ncbi:MAG: hypothetical protein O2780_07775 [Proteobacteria bacterium]|jgi:peroxiredoxin|nr:hypothetical protein [Pseudomonadota bacterium]MDA1298708.1 hypothetical protein [Pseudomonadota bacterium]
MAEKLAGGDAFPRMTLNVTGGGTLTLPDDLGEAMSIVLYYRGYW